MNQQEMIEERLQQLGMTWYMLGKESGIPEGTLYRIKSHRMNARAPHLVNPIAETLGLDPIALTVAGHNIPTDVEEALIQYPQLISIVRNLRIKLESQQG